MAATELRGKRQLTVGLIGCGGVVEGCHLPALKSVPGETVEWVCDLSAERARRIARDWGIHEAFQEIADCPDVDAVLVATPVGTRREILAKVSERGWHALCEKPFAREPRVHREMLEAAAGKGLILGAGFMRRHFWSVKQARSMVRANVLGRLVEIDASESARLDRTGLDQTSYRNNSVASGSGVLTETGCHLLDQLIFVADAQSVEITESEQKLWDGYEVETVASGVATLPSGDAVRLRFVVSGVRSVFNGISFHCELGEIRITPDPAKGIEVLIGKAQSSPLKIPHPDPGENNRWTPYRDEWLHFLEAIRTIHEWDAVHETGLLTTDVIAKCVETAKARYSGVEQ